MYIEKLSGRLLSGPPHSLRSASSSDNKISTEIFLNFSLSASNVLFITIRANMYGKIYMRIDRNEFFSDFSQIILKGRLRKMHLHEKILLRT